MQSEIRTREKRKLVRFPKLMRSKINGTIVLFSGEKMGMVVYTEAHGNFIGEFTSDWAMCNFVDFDESVLLSNHKKGCCDENV